MQKIAGVVVGAVAASVVLLALFGLLIWPLWNWIAAGVFHAPSITYWQAVGGYTLIVLLAAPFSAKVKTKQ